MTKSYVFLLSVLFTLGQTFGISTVSEEPVTKTTELPKTTEITQNAKKTQSTESTQGTESTHSTASPTTEKHATVNSTQKSNVFNPKEFDENGISDETWVYENKTDVDTRRIMYSITTPAGKRPYMVYLQLTMESAKVHKYPGWLCGGVIIDKSYVLTSAACVEDADRFYIVSGTTKFVDSFDYKSDPCVCQHRRKVVWKCIPKNYKFDFQDTLKWSANDIAVVKVDKPFKFGVCEPSCEFATSYIFYNNISRDLECPDTKGVIAGWGSGSNFREGVYRKCDDKDKDKDKIRIPENAACLQEARVCIMEKSKCCKKWSDRFKPVIAQFMICTKDINRRLSEICDKRFSNCSEIDDDFRRTQDLVDTNRLLLSSEIDLGRHLRDPDDYTARRAGLTGGFCENDHGGPLIINYQQRERVIGIISACKIDPKSHTCHGPFLYTSVFCNRKFIHCAIYKEIDADCRRVFRSGITFDEWHVSWDDFDEQGVSTPLGP